MAKTPLRRSAQPPRVRKARNKKFAVLRGKEKVAKFTPAKGFLDIKKTRDPK